jgi:hypothetical protein
MERKFRVSAGAIIIRGDEILLVRAKNSDGNDFLVGRVAALKAMKALIKPV